MVKKSHLESEFGSATSLNASVMRTVLTEVDSLQSHIRNEKANRKYVTDKVTEILTMLAENRKETPV